jgi:rubrerythrin
MPGARELLDELAQDEIEHEALFRGLLDKDDYSSLAKGPVPQDLRLAEYLIAMPLTTESTPQDILIHAIKMEKNAVELYEAWKTLYEDTELEPLIAGLVAEEKRHRARLEAVYNDNFLKDW